MHTIYVACSIVILYLTQYTDLTSGQTKTYRAATDIVCAGSNYELGCGIADGTQVLNITTIYLLLDAEDAAFQCAQSGLCQLPLQTIDDILPITSDQSVLQFYKSIVHNCQGKPKCEGTFPASSRLAPFFDEIYDGVCGYDEYEYFSSATITASCHPAGTIPTLAPHPYGGSEGGVTDPPTTPLTQSESTTTEKTITSLSTTQKPTDKPALTTTSILKNGRTAPVSGGSGYSELTIMYIVLSTVAGVAVLVGLIIAAYIVFRRVGNQNITL